MPEMSNSSTNSSRAQSEKTAPNDQMSWHRSSLTGLAEPRSSPPALLGGGGGPGDAPPRGRIARERVRGPLPRSTQGRPAAQVEGIAGPKLGHPDTGRRATYRAWSHPLLAQIWRSHGAKAESR